MHKILLADDEKTTTDVIKYFIESNDFNLEVVGAAENGEEALEMIRELVPDIVLTDVKMPIMNGIELSRHIRAEYPYMKIIFISGYQDVDYLHSALKVDAVDYILKPVKPKELSSVLHSVTKILDNELHKKEQLYAMERRIMQSVPLLRQRLFMLMINGWEDDIAAIRQQMDFLDIRFPDEERLCVICISMNNYKEMVKGMALHERQCLTFGALNILQEMIDKYLNGYAFENTFGELVGILSLEKKEYENDFFEFAQKVKESFKEILELDVTICVGEITNSLSTLSVSYSGAKAAIENDMFLDENKVISMDSISNTVSNWIISDKTYERITNLLRKPDEAELAELTKEIFDKLKNRSDGYGYDTLSICIQLIMCGMKFLNEVGLYSSDVELYEHQGLQKLTQSDNIDDMQKIISEYYSYICHEMQSKRTNKPKNIVSAIKEFIRKFYADNIRIDDIAAEVFLSPTYMCLVFKKETGMTINEYLTNVRIDEAKRLIEAGSMKLIDVGMSVGYSNQSYFAKQFKKRVGCNPSEYGRKNNE